LAPPCKNTESEDSLCWPEGKLLGLAKSNGSILKRFVIAITTFVVGLSLTAIGIVDQVRNSPLETIRVGIEAAPDRPFVVIPNRTLTAYPGRVEVIASGAEQVFIATVRESDATAWIGETAHQELRLLVDIEAKTARLNQFDRPGEGELVDPVGQDIWRNSKVGAENAKIVVPAGNETAVLVASDGNAVAPESIEIKWTLPPQPLPFSPLPPIGLALMLAGSLLIMIDWWLKRRRARIGRNYRGPKPPRPTGLIPFKFELPQIRKPSAKPKRGRRGMSFVALSLVAASLAGCTATYESPIVSPSPSAAADVLTPVMTREQLERILDEVVAVVSEADAELDREGIEVRVTGAALAIRRAAYNLARRTAEENDGPEPIVAGPIKLFLPSATDTWPRSVMVVTGEERLQLLVLTQSSPRDNYQLQNYTSLLPGATFPEVSAEEVGANAVKVDSKFLAFDPKKLPEAVGDLINNPGESAWAALIDADNQYMNDLVTFQQNLSETLSNANLNFGHRLGDNQIVLLSSADGGALVALYMIDTYTIIPRSPGDAVAITGDEALLLGTGGSATGIETRYGAMLLFHVPASGSESPVQLLGATQQLLTAITIGAR
jgi:hypothetical protein